MNLEHPPFPTAEALKRVGKWRAIQTTMVSHFQVIKHKEKDFTFTVLYAAQTNNADMQKLLLRQAFWIYRLNSLSPYGMNLDLDYSAYL